MRDSGEKESKIQRYAALMDAKYQEDARCFLESMSLEQKRDDQRLRASLSDMKRPIERIEDRIKNYETGVQARTRTQILSWLSPIQYIQHHVQAKSDVGTGQSLLSDDRLLEWQYSGSSSILWPPGIPGSGKSNLV